MCSSRMFVKGSCLLVVVRKKTVLFYRPCWGCWGASLLASIVRMKRRRMSDCNGGKWLGNGSLAVSCELVFGN